jgi:carboxymethylenebutenolidase
MSASDFTPPPREPTRRDFARTGVNRGNAAAVRPIGVAGRSHAALLGRSGGKGEGIALQDADRVKGTLAAGNAAAGRSESVVYLDAPHAIHAEDRPSRGEAAAAGRCQAWWRGLGVA